VPFIPRATCDNLPSATAPIPAVLFVAPALLISTARIVVSLPRQLRISHALLLLAQSRRLLISQSTILCVSLLLLLAAALLVGKPIRHCSDTPSFFVAPIRLRLAHC
jgi:hypothetical protein